MVWWLKRQPQEPHVPSLARDQIPLEAPFLPTKPLLRLNEKGQERVCLYHRLAAAFELVGILSTQ